MNRVMVVVGFLTNQGEKVFFDTMRQGLNHAFGKGEVSTVISTGGENYDWWAVGGRIYFGQWGKAPASYKVLTNEGEV